MVRSGEMDRWVPPDRVVFCGKHDTQLVAARSLHEDLLMVSLMPLLQRVPPATPGNFPLS
jgi:hypothetical protein